jgi:ribosomal protein S4E
MFDVGNVVMVTGGRNKGNVGVMKKREKHKGSFFSFDTFTSKMQFAMILQVSLPKDKGISCPRGKEET